MTVLSLDGVSKRIGSRTLVQDIAMTVEPGEVYGFLGPNGAGKTTTIRMIVGLIKPTAGQIHICGHDIQKERREALRSVGTIVENPETYSYLSGRQNLLHYARLTGIPRKKIKPRIDEVAEIVGLSDRLDDLVKRYSLGMRQRLGVAQALLAQPRLLVLDEPTNGLDPAGIREFRQLIRNLAADGMSVFISSHMLSEIQQMCDRVAVLNQGKILTEKAVTELLDSEPRYRLCVSSLPLAQSILQSWGKEATEAGKNELLITIDHKEVPAMVRLLVESNVDIHGVAEDKSSLEEAFLAMTGEEGEAAIVAGKGEEKDA
ncbi:ABC transporter ATP-binding protein [Desmospora activa]|uniref:ABC-2 type transport system ATP-binding protein n=1 Tax=Desmospora activa DSM 45169 TaxID=1121389 RepID=A0A2T4Z7E2_9BACL|nr:ABC transporter ATP-binding protein [Desmospora activa]PTM57811.1 ABC-2 type transport system ATP-binding protein [Desmospora activa DSM 45169]